MVLARAEARWTEARVLEHQVELHDEKRGVESDEPGQAEPDVSRGHRRHPEMRGQYLADRPWLAAILGDDPAQFDCDPRQRNAPQRNMHQPAVDGKTAAGE